MFVYNTVLLMVGSPAAIGLAVITSIMGVAGLGAAVEGYLLDRANWLERFLMAAAAIVLIYPGWLTDTIGMGILAGVMLWQWAGRRHRI